MLRAKLLILLLVSVAVAVSACGFQPAYRLPSGSADVSSAQKSNYIEDYYKYPAIKEEFLQIDVASVNYGRQGRILENELKNRFDPLVENPTKKYTLNITITKNLIASAIKTTREIRRYKMDVTASYKLINNSNKKEITSGASKISGSYDKGVSDFATYAAEEDALEKIMNEIASDITTRLTIHFAKTHKVKEIIKEEEPKEEMPPQ